MQMHISTGHLFEKGLNMLVVALPVAFIATGLRWVLPRTVNGSCITAVTSNEPRRHNIASSVGSQSE